MSTDKTLADVQPGGRVRLGDGWSGWATQYPNKMPKLCGAREIAELNHYPEEGQRLIFLAENPVHVGDLVDAARAALPFVAFAYSKGVAGAEEAGRAIEAALPAQPSPGGQGDAREQFEEYRGGDCERDAQGYYVNARTAQDWAMWQAALAARQSVGEPVAEAIEQLADDVESCVSDACGYLASDSGWDDYGIYRDDAAARYRALPDRIRALAAAPAQVVDLGRIRSTVQALLNWIDDWAETPEESGIDAIEIEAAAVLDLIDSHTAGGQP
ncbi:TPA: hypothetical protein UNK09_001915 [Stenotrophomonas maltophilia]|nr:hypothetical protein [Stenotrophomonas maltophilia]